MEKAKRRDIMDVNATAEEKLGLLSDVLPQVVEQFRRLDAEGRDRLLRTLATLFSPDSQITSNGRGPVTAIYGEPSDRFSKELSLSPKEFLLKKQPVTDIDRVACLAYYLAHYRNQQHFKTLDLSKLNTEAAQTKLSNPTRTVENSVRRGFLVPAVKGSKQLSAIGEKYVESLPDREAAIGAMNRARPKRFAKRKRIVLNGNRSGNIQEA